MTQGTVANAAELGDSPGDALVEARVERLELLVGDVRVALDGKLHHDLADVSVVVNHLRNGEALADASFAMGSRGDTHLDGRHGRRGTHEGVHEMGQEERHAAIELFRGRPWCVPFVFVVCFR